MNVLLTKVLINLSTADDRPGATMDDALNKFFAKQLIPLKLIWGVLLTFQLALVVVIFLVIPEPQELTRDRFDFNTNSLPIVFASMAFFNWFIAHISMGLAKHRLLSKPWQREQALQQLERGSSTLQPLNAEDLAYVRTLSDAQVKEIWCCKKLFNVALIRMVLTESGGLIGFVAANILKSPLVFLPFFIVSVLLFVHYRPRRDMDLARAGD